MKKIESPAELLNLAVGYQRSNVLFTFAELKIPDILNKKKSDAKTIAKRLKIDPLAMERFLNACVSVGLLEKENDKFSNSGLSESFLTEDKEFYLGGQMKRYQNRSYPNWKDLTKHLKNWQYGENSDDDPDDEDQGEEALAEQHNLAVLHGRALAQSFDFSNYKKLLDIGGGTGAMSIGLCEELENLNAAVFDLPETIDVAKKFVKKSSLENRIELIGGDVQKDDLPDDFDVALLANLLAVFDEKDNKKLFKRIYNKLPKDGACLISGWILDDNHFAPEISALFCLEDICWNAPDVERDFSVYKNWLEEAGFREVEVKTYLEPTKLISAVK